MPIIRKQFDDEEPSLSSVLSLKLPVDKADVPIENPFSPLGDVREYTLYNQKMSVAVISYGAAIREVFMCDKTGKTRDVVLGYDTYDEYKADPYYIGVVCGPLTNRTANAEYKIDGDTVELEANDGNNHIHGGKTGCAKNIWSGHVVGKSVVFEYVSGPCRSKAGKLAPTELCIRCAYTLTDDDDLVIEYQGFLKTPAAGAAQEAAAEKPPLRQPISVTNHSYFNLNGHTSGAIYKHWLKIEADEYTPLNDEHLPTGEVKSVKKCSEIDLNFTEYKQLNTTLVSDPKQWFDANFVLRKPKAKKKDTKFACADLKLAASMYDEESGIALSCHTDAPCLQLYTANYVEEARGKKGHVYRYHDALCLETQNYSNAINEPSFPAESREIFLAPGDVYTMRTVYSFHTREDGAGDGTAGNGAAPAGGETGQGAE